MATLSLLEQHARLAPHGFGHVFVIVIVGRLIVLLSGVALGRFLFCVALCCFAVLFSPWWFDCFVLFFVVLLSRVVYRPSYL